MISLKLLETRKVFTFNPEYAPGLSIKNNQIYIALNAELELDPSQENLEEAIA